MFGRSKKIIRQSTQRVKNTNEFCVCPQCNFSIQHEQGIPCRPILCPYCKIYLERGGANSENSKSTFNKENNTDFPKVNTVICIGCGACIDVCPMDAIEMVNGKASIVEEKCKNCRVCKSVCPMEAIR